MPKMPVIFVGHGSPMNAIEDNIYSRGWREMTKLIPKPKAIVSISAHWYTKGTKIMNEKNPKTIYDMYGFPKELYEIVYNSLGNPDLAQKSKNLITKESEFDNTWGIDHGTWSVLVHMYPDRDIPVFQISIDATASPGVHYEIGKELKSLRDEGVLIFGTGNIVHNLRLVNWNTGDTGFDWAYEFDNYIKENIQNGNHENIINYQSLGDKAKLAVPIADHFYPMLYILGASDKADKVQVFNDKCILGSLSMTSYLIG
ncbi:4,5-DOPA dioxygenase extradiol [Tissierella creatinini]|nr:4,5-DOPA dioxygenase extradiol [Tissierella creatinini]TJX62793.1 4,5-DOPA dioxygenase extradiol [Soehngenia saccharolytica]